MNGDRTAQFAYLLALLVFLMSAFVIRRVPIGRSLKMFGGWILIFLAVFVLFLLKDDIAGLARRVTDARSAESTGRQIGEELQISQASDGHFWVEGRINGRTARFLIDSGATITSISGATARDAGIATDSSIPAVVETANGTVAVQTGVIKRLEIGRIVRDDLAVHISDGFGDTNVLGMNFLSSLSGWRVEHERLILQP